MKLTTESIGKITDIDKSKSIEHTMKVEDEYIKEKNIQGTYIFISDMYM